MPELPDITIHIGALERRVLGQALKDVCVRSPFLGVMIWTLLVAAG
jgi:hypothetical protein